MFTIKNAKTILLALIFSAFMLTACSSEEQTSQSGSSQDSQAEQIAVEDILVDAVELTVNPLTGAVLADGVQEGTRPVAIMVNNSKTAMPQRGIAAADAVIEMVTEGGITRLLAMYSNPAAVPQVGSVRSARDQHLQFAIPTNSIVVHIGTSVYASNLLNTYTYKTIDGRYQGTTSFWFDELRATTRASEHCWYTDANLIAAGIAREQLPTTGISYSLVNFKSPDENIQMPSGGDAANISFSFSSTNTTKFTYDSASGTYKKFVYDAEHRDEEGEQLAFGNVLVLFTPIGIKDDNYCVDYDLAGGEGFYFNNGKYTKIIWEKGAPEDPLIIKDTNGETYDINTGKTYIGVLGTGNYDSLLINDQAPPIQ